MKTMLFRTGLLACILTAALPPLAAAASKPVPRTVMTLMASCDCTVAMALPA